MHFKYYIGEVVIYINDYGAYWGTRIISEFSHAFSKPSYYIHPTSTPWFSVPERNLYKIRFFHYKRKKKRHVRNRVRIVQW